MKNKDNNENLTTISNLNTDNSGNAIINGINIRTTDKILANSLYGQGGLHTIGTNYTPMIPTPSQNFIEFNALLSKLDYYKIIKDWKTLHHNDDTDTHFMNDRIGSVMTEITRYIKNAKTETGQIYDSAAFTTLALTHYTKILDSIFRDIESENLQIVIANAITLQYKTFLIQLFPSSFGYTSPTTIKDILKTIEVFVMTVLNSIQSQDLKFTVFVELMGSFMNSTNIDVINIIPAKVSERFKETNPDLTEEQIATINILLNSCKYPSDILLYMGE